MRSDPAPAQGNPMGGSAVLLYGMLPPIRRRIMTDLATRGLSFQAIVMAALLVVTGCGPSDARDRPGWAGTVDTLTNGVVRVSSPESGVWPEGAGWRLVEELRIGSAMAEGPAMFGQVVAIEADEDGRIYVADSQAQEIRVFGPDGAHLLSFGRRGGGPGEFEQISGMGWGPDGNLWVMDARNSRFAVFDRSGRHVADHRRPGGFTMMPWPGGFDSAGRIYDIGMLPAADGPFRIGLIRYDPVGDGIEPRDTFAIPEFEGDMFRLQDSQGRPRVAASVPFTSTQFWRLADGHVWIGVTDAYRFHRIRFEGDTLRVVERAFSPAPVTPAERDSVVASMTWFTDQGGRVDRSRIPDRKPAFRTLVEDDSGHLWVWPHLAAGEVEGVDVFDPEGRYLGRVPTGLPVPASPVPVIRGDRFYAVLRDDLDIQYVARLRIQGRGLGPPQ